MAMGAFVSGLVVAQTPVPADDRTNAQDPDPCAGPSIDPGFLATVPGGGTPIDEGFHVPGFGATPVDPGFIEPVQHCPTKDEEPAEGGESGTPEHSFRLIAP